MGDQGESGGGSHILIDLDEGWEPVLKCVGSRRSCPAPRLRERRGARPRCTLQPRAEPQQSVPEPRLAVVKSTSRSPILLIVQATWFALRLVASSSPGLLAVSAATTIVFGLLPTVQVVVGKLVLDATVGLVAGGGNAAAVTAMAHALVLQAALLVGQRLLQSVNGYAQTAMGLRLVVRLQGGFLQKTKLLEFSRFEDPEFHDMLSRARRECATRPLELLSRSMGIGTSVLSLLSLGAVLASLDIMLVVGMVIVCLPMLAVEMIYGAKAYNLEFGRTDARRLSEILSTTLTERRCVPQITSFNLFDYIFGRWQIAAQTFLQQDVRLRRRRSIAESVSGTTVAASTVAATAYVLYANFSRHLGLSVGQITMYGAAFSSALAAWQGAMGALSGIYEGSLFLHDMVAFQSVQPGLRISSDTRDVPAVISELRLENVSYRYPGSNAWVLRNVNLTFRRSQSTLLVGSNGAGKTTLTKLLIRLYEPTEGRILLDGVDVREYSVQSLRRSIAVVFQDFLQLPFTVQENIGCGCVERLADGEGVRAAARRAGADEFVQGLPLGYDTVLSKLFKGGCELSYGQWQRICIARLFMKQAPVCILDEPTASLDVEAEAALLREINRMSLGSISILISHRALRPGIADRIVVLSQGQVVESGEYEDLMRGGGEFARLATLYHSAGAIRATAYPDAVAASV